MRHVGPHHVLLFALHACALLLAPLKHIMYVPTVARADESKSA